MMPREREFYNLEAFWGHAERILIPNFDDQS
ncbi:MAG: ribosome silencing factor, partial [Dolichospermum sp.]